MVTVSSGSSAENFLMPVEDVFKIENRGVLVLGRRERGELRENQEVEVLGLGESFKLLCVGVEKYLGDVARNDHRGYLLAGKNAELIRRGHALAIPGSANAYAAFQVRLTIPVGEKSGQFIQLLNGHRAQFLIRSANVAGRLQFPAGLGVLASGGSATVTVILDQPVALEPGVKIFMRNEKGRTTGSGIIAFLGGENL